MPRILSYLILAILVSLGITLATCSMADPAVSPMPAEATPLASAMPASASTMPASASMVTPSPNSGELPEATATATVPTRTSTVTHTSTSTATGTPTLTPTPTGLIGQVTDAGTGKPLADALLLWGNTEVETDTMGYFSFANVISDGLPIEVQAPGYHRTSTSWEGQHQLDLALTAREFQLVLFDRVSYTPLAGATVSGPGVQAETDAQGATPLRGLAVGTELTLMHPDYEDQVVGYQGRAELLVPMTPYLFQGRVLDSLHDVPIAGAEIVAERDGGDALRATSDAEGWYTLKGKVTADALNISAAGYLTTTQQLTATQQDNPTQSEPLVTYLEPFIVKGVYVPYWVLSLPDRLAEILELVETTELNTIVVDVKSDEGRIAHESDLEIAQEGDAYFSGLQDLAELVQYCHERDIYVIGRMVVFKDPIFTSVRPEHAIKRESGEPYTDLEEMTWADPFKQAPRDYNIGLAKEVAALGFDEIQFDYLRFPSDGVISDLTYEITETMETRTTAIATFCAQAYEELKPLGVMVSADIFGLTAWVDDQKRLGDLGIGQRIIDIGPHMDYLSLMLYPDTFSLLKMELGDPVENPYELVFRSCQHARARTDTKLRPWISHYWGDLEYYMAQKEAAEDAKTYGWMFWNSGGKYREPGLFDPVETPASTE